MRTFPTAESSTGLITRTVRIWIQSLQSSRFPRVLEFTVQRSELPSSPEPSSSIRIDLRGLERKAAMKCLHLFYIDAPGILCIALHRIAFLFLPSCKAHLARFTTPRIGFHPTSRRSLMQCDNNSQFHRTSAYLADSLYVSRLSDSPCPIAAAISNT